MPVEAYSYRSDNRVPAFNDSEPLMIFDGHCASPPWRCAGIVGIVLDSYGAGTMATEFNVVIERDADGLFVASVPALPGCHTQAATRDELMSRIREAIALHLEDRGGEIEPLEFIAVERVTVAA